MPRRPGWAWPSNSRKAHYYGADSRSLCGKYVMLGGQTEDGLDESPDNCAACKRKLAAQRAASTPEVPRG